MTGAPFTLADINRLAGGSSGTHDVPCPWCGPVRRSPVNQRRRVLRVWRIDTDFASYHCARCGEHGHVTERRHQGRPVDREALARAKADADKRERVSRAERLEKARWLWSQRRPIIGTPAERYLQRRGYVGPLPPTLAYLPARGEYPHALIAAFGIPTEPEPGELAIADTAVLGVHITRLEPDGTDRERGDGAKIMVGRSAGWPIVLAPLNDLLGLAITEGGFRATAWLLVASGRAKTTGRRQQGGEAARSTVSPGSCLLTGRQPKGKEPNLAYGGGT
jgi:hypothetical protein